MNYKPHYDDSEYTDMDDIYDEETDYYTEDSDLSDDYEDKMYPSDMSQFKEYNYWS